MEKQTGKDELPNGNCNPHFEKESILKLQIFKLGIFLVKSNFFLSLYICMYIF